MTRIVLLAVLVVAGCKDKGTADTHDQSAGKAKTDIARLGAQRFAFEAYPMWAREHADKACPDKIDDLYQYVSAADRNDPWGAPYHMLCGANLPAGARGFAVFSLGEDGKEGTADDIKSWEK